MLTLDQKKKIVVEINESFSQSEGVVISQYSGLNVNQLTELRSRLRNVGVSSRVLKNRIVKRVLNENNIQIPDTVLKGQNIFFNTDSDIVAMCKEISSFAEDNEHLSVKGGVLQGNYIDREQVETLSKLPGKQELVATTVARIKGPITGLVYSLSSPLNALINVLNNIKNNK